MAISYNDLLELLQKSFSQPGQIELQALSDDGEKYKVTVYCDSMKGLSRIEQHRKVLQVIGDRAKDIHALSISVKTSD